uniref:Uncharacterized protein n=1 Tax=Chromera velia CCMP2878 TaxID=1169474 RepID=A0A0G4FTN6_9ALVE|eukprot:Cvel_3752.t1-p1 / transcript=Cvel_3752.t1 / gene=Cvel_3752 / organism=Chromera_velia_CCMP2878 / gene_product=hypothetical protein / transcript_product=hypothetical protein / location=Cvel_scaffold156:122093-123741(-) / protein_length=397 / sequence_SO=supercontig / SO=protein_coding / is_pseudo=false
MTPGAASRQPRHGAVDEALEVWKDLISRHGNWFDQQTRQRLAEYTWGARECLTCASLKNVCPRPGKEGEYWEKFFKRDQGGKLAGKLPANDRDAFLMCFAYSIVNLNAKVKQPDWFELVLSRLSSSQQSFPETFGLGRDDLCTAFEDLVGVVAMTNGIQSALAALDCSSDSLPPFPSLSIPDDVKKSAPPRNLLASWTKRLTRVEWDRMPLVLSGNERPGFAPKDSEEAWAIRSIPISIVPFAGPTLTPGNLAALLRLCSLFYIPPQMTFRDLAAGLEESGADKARRERLERLGRAVVQAPFDREEMRAARVEVESHDGVGAALDGVLVASFFQMITRVVDANDHQNAWFAVYFYNAIGGVNNGLKWARRNRSALAMGALAAAVGTVLVVARSQGGQ